MFAFDPFVALYVVPNVQAHLSAFSAPLRSYQAFKSGSVTASSSSCAMIDTMASAPMLPFGDDTVCSAHDAGHCMAGLPINAYLISEPLIVPCVCQPQYC